ncbi:MAG: double-strand break repair helicase AddA [Pikeienuella sp.]|uniref:double-strand break repair helicase AddA n=1 Tax=Pikeienuella sp. TaxID=2831957 RepID=UPI00391A54C9
MSAPVSAVEAQRRAADPARSVWVAANAGSGKTRVLTERVARLLLDGARPEAILCLTYTKAAAAEMRNRLFDTLGKWAMMEDDDLRGALRALTGEEPPQELAPARRLFAAAMETPGGLKIQTIHAFCDALLRRFPLEAGAPPGFRVMEERERAAAISALLDDMARAGGADRAALAGVAAERNEDGLAALAAAAAKRAELFPDPPDEPALSAAFGVPHPPDRLSARMAALSALDRDALRRMIAAWAHGAKTDKGRAATLEAALGRNDDGLADALDAAVLKKTADEGLKDPASKGAQAAEPDWQALCEQLVSVALEVREAGRAADAAERAIRLARFGGAFVRRWRAAKAARGMLDFDDLVGRARDLLTRSDMAAWALYRLDGGVDHILVDEAQDTAPAQWAVIDAIAAEFRAGEGARRGGRTSFVVGDEKQSIYSFQGADAEMFSAKRAEQRRLLAPFGGLAEEALEASFRSAPAILEAVDATFNGERGEGLTAEGVPPRHKAFFAERAGRVELWPLTEPDAKAEAPEPWAPVDLPGRRDARVKLAVKVAERVAAMIGKEPLPGASARPVEAGDILILLRKRAPIMGPLVTELKRRGVPVAGADRISLSEALAVKDLSALMRFALTPEDDLTLAALLRSPLFDVDEEGLFDLAHGRKGTLWRALEAAEARWPREVRLLREARAMADRTAPFEFLERALLAPDEAGRDGRRRLLHRLGREAEDAIDELLSLALAYEAEEIPSLEGFLAWLEAGESEIARERGEPRGEVRVMTVHGAKGLQAPVVILPDTTGRATSGKPDPVVEIETGAGPRAAWRGSREAEPRLLAAIREREAEAEAAESRRLLYVAMTRAEDWLIVAGAGEEDKEKEGAGARWRDLVAAGMAELGAKAGEDGVLVHETPGVGKTPRIAAAAAIAEAEMEGWMAAPPAPAPQAQRRLAASALGDGEVAGGAGAGAEAARLRGVAVHAALERGLAPGDEPLLARVMRAEGTAPAPDALTKALEIAVRARAAPGAARFFAPEAVAEAPVSLLLDGARVAGRIDRLVVAEGSVAFVDFKTDARPPEGPSGVPEAYRRQMEAYAAALRRLYPGRRAEGFILWTEAGRLDLVTG